MPHFPKALKRKPLVRGLAWALGWVLVAVAWALLALAWPPVDLPWAAGVLACVVLAWVALAWDLVAWDLVACHPCSQEWARLVFYYLHAVCQ